MKPKFEVGEIVLNNLTQQLSLIVSVGNHYYGIDGITHSRFWYCSKYFIEVTYSSHSKAFNKVRFLADAYEV